ncbi:anaerobic sulfite reductase subunit B [Sporomusaceae bacterium BoRhaA]|uniref:anaerobic sulfite reductase subunit AsrB n=1 Tax=Pelorhabdus rhamnosifermentans TaxID=2772457 RepID=UPI001C062845|nr:anaerobic sulfite reductase subunit AsrB [Pelorhabdus rhamnosifermentans]MBU2700394.1 anaerobic sulfite reductase subunit B [Pelorhabdus rhamnosifermentans]
MPSNEYIPFLTEIRDVIKHTDIEYTFRVTYEGNVKPGQFFEVSIPKYGEAPISVSGIGNGTVDLTIRRVGKVTHEIFEHYVGDKLFMRGPYGNGFDIDNYKGKELVVIVGGTGLSPVKGIVDYFCSHREETKNMTLIAGFKTPKDVLFSTDFGLWKKKMNVILTVDNAENDTTCKTGLVTQYIPQLNFENFNKAVAIVVGPPMMMKFTTQGLLERGFKENNIWISYERKMCCGIGKCGHCKTDDTYICLDGPVFNFVKGRQLFD